MLDVFDTFDFYLTVSVFKKFRWALFCKFSMEALGKVQISVSVIKN